MDGGRSLAISMVPTRRILTVEYRFDNVRFQTKGFKVQIPDSGEGRDELDTHQQ